MGSSCSRDSPATKLHIDQGTGSANLVTYSDSNSCLLAVKFVNGEKILIFKYDSAKDEWPICHEIPVEGIFRTVIVKHYILFIDWMNAKRICCYDTTTRAIRTLEPIKRELILHYFATEFENKLYLFGDMMDKRNVHVWDPTKDSWSSAAALNVAREHAAAVSHGGFLYVAGGRKDNLFNSELRSVERYDPRRRSWQRCADLGQSRCGANMASAGAYIYIVGGECAEIPTNVVERYDTQLNKWTQIMCMQIPKQYPACVYFNNRLFACGGPTMDQDCSSVEEFDEATNKWCRKSDMPVQGPFTYVIATPEWIRQLESLNSKTT